MKKYLFGLLIMMVSAASLKSQQHLLLYNMDHIPQSVYANPGHMPWAKVNIGLPIISSIYGNFANTGFRLKDLLVPTGDSLSFDPDNMISKLKNKNLILAETHLDLFHLGFRVKEKNYFNASWTVKGMTRVGYSKDLMLLAWKGNGHPAVNNHTLDFTGLALDAMAYHEFALGYTRQVNDKLSVGGRLKYLKGILNARFFNDNVTLSTDPTTFDITATAGYEFNYAGNVFDTNYTNTHDKFGDYFMKGNNNGFGVDLGAEYQLNEKISLSASVTDLGMLTWKTNPVNYVTDEATFTFSGIDLNEIENLDSVNSETLDSLVNNILDSLETTFKPEETHKNYKSPLPSRFYIGGNYKLNDNMGLGVLFSGDFYRGSFYPAATLSYNVELIRWLQASVAWSYWNRSFTNVGLGAAVNLGPIQIYGVSNNLLGALNLAATKTAHFHGGMNLTFGRPEKDRDKDGVPDKEDECPDTPGLVDLAGCPDKDNDKISDIKDKCPDVPGLAQYEGCPDTDNDGIIDQDDKCPTIKGPKETFGCPDRDLDGVLDSLDKCPDLKGDPAHFGCPDTDGDGLYDHEDKCVNLKGNIEAQGCPDKDLDGIFDMDDQCPELPGPKELNGCPDDDKDGVINPADSCPQIPGPKDNNGCPKLTKEEEKILEMAFDNLEFETGKSIIRKTSYPSLNNLAELMKNKPEWKLKLAGHTDNVGDDNKNMILSKDRANAVAKYLADKGVDSSRFIVEWFGETKPVADNTTPAGRQQNRRVEMTVIFK